MLIEADILRTGEAEASDAAATFVPLPGNYEQSQLARFRAFCECRTGRFFCDHAAFDTFAVEEAQTFWALFADWSALPFEGETSPAWTGCDIETASFFPNLRVNYAESVLAGGNGCDPDTLAVIACGAGGVVTFVTWMELRQRVQEMALTLGRLGLGKGDRVAGVLRNDDKAIVICLAVAAIGATFSTAAPEMAAVAISSRFSRLAPRLIISHGASTQDPGLPAKMAEIADELKPELGLFLLDMSETTSTATGVRVHSLANIHDVAGETFSWDRFSFNHPLFVLFSSGTTGAPKCIVHGAGGTLIEHMKEHRLHCDISAADRLFFFSSCAWMMWNWQLSALASGATLVVYDGPITGPETLWRIVADHQVTVFGTSPPYLKLCADCNFSPASHFDFTSLRSILSTGSILQDEQFDWVKEQVKPLPLQSISGGTDIIGCFVLGHPGLPVHRGEAQSRSLGLDVRVLPRPDVVLETDVIGELVCAAPFPSRPVGFLNDESGKAFHAAYFADNPGLWTHGDLISISADRGYRMRGRSDGILNVRGMRIGPAEIYAAILDIKEVKEALAVEQVLAAGASRIVLLVTLQDGLEMDGALALRVKTEIGRRTSAAHVPTLVLQVTDLPTTHSGKRSERAAADAINGRFVTNRAALRNPETLDELACLPQLHGLPGPVLDEIVSPPADASTVERVCGIWQRLFAQSAIGAADDFFHLGGDSILAFSLFIEIEREFGLQMPMSVLFNARTASELAALVDAGTKGAHVSLVSVRAGEGRPVFAVHGLSGTVVEQRDFLTGLAEISGRPIFALQAVGIDPQEVPHRSVEEMAAHYLGALREVQPEGPYAICGYSFGGLVAYEVAQRLVGMGERVELLGMLDVGFHPRNLSPMAWLRFRIGRLGVYRDAIKPMSLGQKRDYFFDEIVNARDSVRLMLGLTPSRRGGVGDGERLLPPPLEEVRANCELAYTRYRPRPFAGTVTLFHADKRDPRTCNSLPIWQRISGNLEIVRVSGGHHDMIVGANGRDLASAVAGQLSEIFASRPACDLSVAPGACFMPGVGG